METPNFIYELSSDPKLWAFVGAMAVIIYLTKDDYR